MGNVARSTAKIYMRSKLASWFVTEKILPTTNTFSMPYTILLSESHVGLR